MPLGSLTTLLSPPTLESLMLKLPTQATEGSMASRDVAEVLHTHRTGHTTRRSLSNKKINVKTDEVDTSQSDKLKAETASEAFTCTPSEPFCRRSLSIWMNAFLTCRKGVRHNLYFMFGAAIVMIAALRLLWFGWLIFHHAMELPHSTAFSHIQNEHVWAMKGMLKSMDQASSNFILEKYEETTFESRKAVCSMEEHKLWRRPNSEGFQQCIDYPRSYKSPKATPNGYIMVNANGGLNQMRDGVDFTSSSLNEFD